jgi:hypothetical protein
MGAAAIPSHQRHGLESVKKADQVVDVGTGFRRTLPAFQEPATLTASTKCP